MTIIITEGELTEQRRNKCCKYSPLFKLINRISKIIEKLEETECTEFDCEENIRAEIIKQINRLLDKIEI